MNSIRSRLLLWQMSALLIVALIAGALTYAFARRGFDHVRDYGLEQIASSVLRHDETPIPDLPGKRSPEVKEIARPLASTSAQSDVPLVGTTGTSEAVDTEPDEGQFVSQIWSPKGILVFSSLEDSGPDLQSAGFHTATWRGQMWRTYTLVRNNRTAQVAVALELRDNSFRAMLPWVLVPTGLMMLLLGLLIHQAVKRALQPLDALSRQIGSRGISELHALDMNNLPKEVAPLAQALNKLLAQLDQLLGSQRQFLADAAHELNTPLAAIKLQAQLTRKAHASERDAALNELDKGIARAIHLAAQLLQLARLEPDAHTPEFCQVQLHELVRQAVISLSPLAESRGTDLGLLRCERTSLMGDPHALRALLDNLIGNALHYSPSGSQVDVNLAAKDGHVHLSVCDNGPGISKDMRERVLERFVRLQPGDTTGSGLGLSIVQRIVESHGGTLTLNETPGGGLSVVVTLPLPGTHPPA